MKTPPNQKKTMQMHVALINAHGDPEHLKFCRLHFHKMPKNNSALYYDRENHVWYVAARIQFEDKVYDLWLNIFIPGKFTYK